MPGRKGVVGVPSESPVPIQRDLMPDLNSVRKLYALFDPSKL
jgi:hypothetical protein